MTITPLAVVQSEYAIQLLNNHVPYCHYVQKNPNSDVNMHSRQLVYLNTPDQCRLQQITYRRLQINHKKTDYQYHTTNTVVNGVPQ